MIFAARLQEAWSSSGSLLCVGIDPDLGRLPATLQGTSKPFLEFGKTIVEATAPYACSFKPQFAHFAAAQRLDELLDLIAFMREVAPRALIILDAKRGDIGSTAAYYAQEAFSVYQADAVTLNPYLGGDTLQPFLENPERGAFILCRTSNPGGGDFQGLVADGKPLFLHVADRAAGEWNANRNVGLVTGATWPEEIAVVRRAAPELPLLVPGIGAQGGDLAAVLEKGLDARKTGLLINASRSILYADKPAQAALELNEQINALRFA